MDKAQQLEMEVLGRQKFMNAVIDDGDSPVQQFYRDTTVFVTGGAGFLGKHLIEKLLRACKLNKIYVLLRPKKGKTVAERLNFMLQDPVYDLLRKKRPEFVNIVEAVEGNISEIKLGLSNEDWTKLTTKVNLIFHMAATVRFDESIHDATITNVRGTRECVLLAKECKLLRCFIHVSTAFTHATDTRTNTVLKETFYPCPMAPDDIIDLAETTKPETLEEITSHLLKEWPNTYTLTKAIAEEVIRTKCGDMPVCVVKPPVVFPAFFEPSPGWCDISCAFGPPGILIAVGLGVLHVLRVETDKKMNIVPIDYVNNAIIATAWDTVERLKQGTLDDIPVFTVSSSKRGIVWDFMGSVIRSDECRRLNTAMSVWYSYLIEVSNPVWYWTLTWLLHYIPAYIAQGICKVLSIELKGIPSIVKFYEKIDKMSKVFGYFLNNEWYFSDDNITGMIQRMSAKDRDIFSCDIYNIDYGQYIKVMIIGLRKYILRDGLKDSEKAYKKQKYLYYANLVFMILYAYVLYYILYTCFRVVRYIVY